MKLSILLPVYNEERTIRAVLENVLDAELPPGVEREVIVVDDASGDRTAEIVTLEPRVTLARHEVNRGKGAAIRTGLSRVTGDIVIIQDADLEYSVRDYPALLRPFIEEGAQAVYGSRFLGRRRPEGMHWSHWLANRILTRLANLLFNAGLTDEATCYKLFRADLLKSLPLRADRFDFCPEVTALVRRRGVAIREVPIAYHARTRAEGKKVRWTDGFAAVKTLLTGRFRKDV